jgi:hypothetical protein
LLAIAMLSAEDGPGNDIEIKTNVQHHKFHPGAHS